MSEAILGSELKSRSPKRMENSAGKSSFQSYHTSMHRSVQQEELKKVKQRLQEKQQEMEMVITKLKDQANERSCEKANAKKYKSKSLYGTKVSKYKETNYDQFIRKAKETKHV